MTKLKENIKDVIISIIIIIIMIVVLVNELSKVKSNEDEIPIEIVTSSRTFEPGDGYTEPPTKTPHVFDTTKKNAGSKAGSKKSN